MKGRVLVIAGCDSGGGAGIQADIKTITALGGYAATAITALTAQNTLGVQAVLPVPPDFVRLQIDCVLDDLGADAFKTGMLGRAEIDCAGGEGWSATRRPAFRAGSGDGGERRRAPAGADAVAASSVVCCRTRRC